MDLHSHLQLHLHLHLHARQEPTPPLGRHLPHHGIARRRESVGVKPRRSLHARLTSSLASILSDRSLGTAAFFLQHVHEVRKLSTIFLIRWSCLNEHMQKTITWLDNYQKSSHHVIVFSLPWRQAGVIAFRGPCSERVSELHKQGHMTTGHRLFP